MLHFASIVVAVGHVVVVVVAAIFVLLLLAIKAVEQSRFTARHAYVDVAAF